jgi:hypothetical protein
MQNHLLSSLQSAFQKGLPFALSFVDDILLFAATKIGLQLPWLQWVSTLLFVVTLLYWTTKLLRFLYFKIATFKS